MKRKTFKHDMPKAIIGMTFEDAKMYCISEGYQLFGKDEPIDMPETYVIKVLEIDENEIVLNAKYGF